MAEQATTPRRFVGRLPGWRGVALASAAVLLAACSGTGSPDPAATVAAGSSGSTDPATSVTRWWDSPGGAAGTTVEAGTIGDAADGRKGWAGDQGYCASLRQTQERSASPPLDSATDPGALPAVLLWASETAAMAPVEIADAWVPIVALVSALAADPGSAVLPDGIAAVQQVGVRIREHAATACGLSITFL